MGGGGEEAVCFQEIQKYELETSKLSHPPTNSLSFSLTPSLTQVLPNLDHRA